MKLIAYSVLALKRAGDVSRFQTVYMYMYSTRLLENHSFIPGLYPQVYHLSIISSYLSMHHAKPQAKIWLVSCPVLIVN